MSLTLLGQCKVPGLGVSASAIKRKFGACDLRCCRPGEALGVFRCGDSRVQVPSKEAGLQLPGPIKECGQRHERIAGELAFRPQFVKFFVVEAAKVGCQSAEGPNKSSLRPADRDHEAEP